ncbi:MULTISPECIES: APC family permease [Streptomycetaceae]|uniref:Amino acid transporter n=1 Tax=Streptantibioticus cattleyicolor (strain ATCC 35852 / DSM 46488 / JCM 4925 / NBRC 14057 / NRRL 8057) TaxID=1003195 RepID=F8K0H1_STREN|nr:MULTISPECIES: APC family permease [Streptomycetaceae]AEW97374.1 amino acid transporter [Streptantibioticus cattleyicolor NRRL 8057 = DSM 46488]MYS61822.1 amino acid permease [Streptomyces sp. SID5468]CCB77698.1 Amino acid transporter [Streptantibioticus cattleyicolor NRRL 8057 = DSM 46488]
MARTGPSDGTRRPADDGPAAGRRPEERSTAPGLRRASLGPLGVLAIAVSAISPTTSVFLVYGSALRSAGTGVVWAFVIGGVIALGMALCYAEAGSLFPSAGGAYTIVHRALGPVAGGVTSTLFLLLGLVSTASILVASATYVSSLVPGGLPVGWLALGMMALVTAVSVGRISPAGWVAGGMLVLELAVVLVFTAVAFGHAAHGVHPITHPVVVSHGAAGPVGAAGLLAAVVPALFAFNGYDWPLYFAEEAKGSRRTGPRAVVVAAVLAVVVEVLAVIAATGAVGDLGRATADPSPLAFVAHQVLGPAGADVLIAGVALAMFDTGLAANLGYARVYYAAARDGMLPGPLGRFFGRVSPRSRVPVRGFLFLLAGNGLLCVFSSLDDLITFTGVMIVIVYLLVAVSALVCRVRRRGARPPFRMPWWPLPPLVAVVGVVVALSRQDPRDLLTAFGLAAVAAAGYAAVRHRLPARARPREDDGAP